MLKIEGLAKIKNKDIREKIEADWVGARPTGWFETVQVESVENIITISYAPNCIALYKIFDDGIHQPAMYLNRSEVEMLYHQMEQNK